MEENKMLEAAPESGSKPPSTTPAYFVILHQSEGDEKEERILVANRDASAVAPLVQPGPHESKSNTFLSADCISGGITVTLDNNNMWNEFYRCSTEMVLTKQGRRMFPYCRYWISGMDPYQKYILAMDITPLDTHKYKWNGKWWEPGGKAEPHVLGRAFIHPESPSTGQYWMHQPVSFYKLKLTNNILDQEGHIILHSMHRYLPRLHVIPADKATEVIQLNGPDVHTFSFPQTEFFAVTAYQNVQITQLKIDCNPFAKGFREGTMVGRPPKEAKPKIYTEAKDSPGSKKLEHDDPESTEKRKASISLSEQSDADTENESVNAKQELRSLSNSQNTVLQNLLLKLNQLSSLGDTRTATTPSVPPSQPKIKIKEEPEDNYDYNKTQSNMGVQVKQEDSDEDVTDEYSHSDDDYPILERHFAQFSTKLHSDRKHSVRSPSGVAKAKLLKLEDGKMPVVYLESCSTKKTAENVSNSQELALPNTAMQSIKQEECSDIFPSTITCKREEFSRTDEKRPIKRKIYADYAVPLNIRSNRGRRKKSPSASSKPRATKTPGNENGEAPIKKRRGRPPKNKGAKVGRPPKKKPPIETSQFPDFKPDLEDVDGVLFVAFSSKEALDVHTGGKPKTDIPLPPPNPAVHVELTEEQQKIVNLERQLLVQLKAMKHRQVIHPALQQVGLRLNIVDHAMSIDLRYLGVELPLPYITSDSRWDNCGLSSEGLPFVSRTGKTTDYTKIKGWRDKFSTNPPIKSEAGSSETTLKNRSAFCSDELDEYLENEAKLMEDFRGTSQNETVVSTVSFQFPTKSASYVRTLDSVLKKQALQASSNSVKISKPPPPPQPVKKRKYTRRTSTPKLKLKAEPVLTSPVAWEKPVKSRSPRKPKSPKGSKLTSSLCVMNPVTSKSEEGPPLSEDDATVQPSGLSTGEESLWSKLPHTPFQSLPFTQRSTGFSKVQMKLMELEESAVYQGKPRTYVTEERAEIALSALLTVQGFLKRKPFHKMISKRTPPCKNEFCRLGCICSSLNNDKCKPVHCQQEACMFGCDCVNGESCYEKDGLNVTPTRCKQNVGEDVDSSTEGKHDGDKHDGQPEKHTDVMDESSESQEEMEKPCISVQGLPGVEAIGIDLGDSADSCLKNWSPKVFPIWNRSDVDNDPEPLCIPEKGEVFEGKPPYHRRKSERGKSSASKSSPLHTPRPAVCLEDFDSEAVQQLNSMTCARVRVYKCKATEEKARKDQGPCADSETPGKENSHKPNKYREREKENAGDNSEVAEKRHKKADSSNPTKLLNIISDCSREQDPKKILNIVSQQVDKKEPRSFRVGSFNIELTSDNKDGDASKSSATSHVKISMAPDQKTDQITAKPPSVKGKTEGIKFSEQIPVETRSENEIKSHGGKGLPFYSKVIPAGRLVARLKNSTLNQSELIQVNGKTFPQAKLLLGQMGALHPANRIAAYITHRLRPNLLYLSKEASAKAAANNAVSESSTAIENSKVPTDGQKTTVASPQSKTVLPSTPSGVFTQVVTGEDGSLEKESPEVRSPEPSAVELPKIHMQSSPLVLISTPVSSSSAVTVVSSSPVNMVSTTPSLLSGAVSPIKNQAATLSTPLIQAPKLVTEDSSLPVTATLSNDTTSTVSLTSGPSPKCVSIPPPALTRAPCPPVTSTVHPQAYPGTNKTLAASVASSLVASANLPTIGLVGSPTGRPTVTLRTVISPSVATPRATLTSGLDKRLGPRLLLIPVSNGSAPVRPVQSVQTSPGQKMVLQPIKGPNGINLFRHPNGQIIQLLPLQQIQAANVQQNQRVVIRSPGPAVSIQLPLKTKTDDATPAFATTGSSSVPPTPALQTVSLSKISPVKSGVTVIPTSPSKIATLRIGTPPRASSEVSPSATKVLSYASSGCGVITSTGVPLRTGGLPILKCSTTTALSSSPQDSAAKPKIILMTSKPAVVIDANKLTNYSFLKSAVIVSASEKNAERENSKECKGISILETDNAANMVKDQSRPKDPVTSAEQEVLTPSVKKMGETEEISAIPSQIMVYGNESKKSDIASRAFLQDTNNQDSLRSIQKSSDGSTDKEAGSPSQTIIVNHAAESDWNVENTVAENAQDPKNPAAENAQDPENPAAENAQDPENPAVENTQDPENTVSENDQDLENPAAERDQDPENAAAESDQDPKNPEAKSACISLEQDNGPPVESACSTVEVQTEDDSEVNQQTPNKSQQDKEDKDRKGDVVTDFPTINEQDENLPSDTGYNSSARESEQNSQSEDESEADESVDIETVEEISERINIARLKATATHVTSYSDKSTVLVKPLKGRKMGSKVSGDDTFSVEGEDVEYVSHRKNHTANERKRRNEMRDLFEELKNSLGLHNLPKVSKSYILKRAIEEIEGLTDTADSLIKQKTSMSQKQSQLIKKMSNLSGKPKEVVLKKLEYLYAKQSALEVESKKSALEGEHKKSALEAESKKGALEAESKKGALEAESKEGALEAESKKGALEAESKKKDFVEDHTLKASVNKPPPPLPPLRLENKANDESSCSKTKKPIILARNHVLHSAGTQQPAVIPIPNLPRASSGQLAAVKEAIVGQVAGIPPTLVSPDVRPVQMPTGMASVVIQLPGTLQLKGVIGNNSIPITLSAVSHTISAVEPSSPSSEDDDLSMMPRIVNVTSLAEDSSSDLYQDIMGFHTPTTKADTDTENNTLLAKKTAASDPLSDQAERDLSSAKQLPSTSHPVDTTEEKLSSDMNITQNSYSSLPENLPLAKVSIVNAEASSKSGKTTINDSSLDNVLENVRDSELELELKKLSSAIEEADLEPSELSDVMADQEDSDETFSSLLNEIAFLNQQLNNDPSEMGCDFPGSDTLSQESIGKSADGNSSPFFFGKFKELSEPKEKNISLSPLFLQIDEGEIQESVKHSEEPGIVVFEDAANKEAMTEVGMNLLQPPANVAFLQAVDQPEVASGSDVFWRPMPKLAPLGLMSSNLPSDQRVLGNKSMPSLASAAVRLSLPKPMD
ncbi:MAX gene-associated protein [Aquarana catesbeiana]|uniref:MAX gene-associated protein n=1 Tax=Aquarana catesbeiana TaxID=8400 RepID=UPI003CCA4889